MYCGIEIGGTKLQIGLGAGDGTLLTLHRETIDAHGGGPAIREQIRLALPLLLEQTGISRRQLLAIGIGFGGPVDDQTGSAITSHQVTGWDNFPMVRWVEETFNTKAVLGNDADVAGLAEARYGAGQGYDPLFYVTVGSGIGGALILNGKIHRGTGVGAGEIGHLWADYDLDQTCITPTKSWNIVEHRASGWAISKAGNVADVRQLLTAIQSGDKAASQVLTRARRRLALAISHVIALLCPRRIVIGGGVSLIGEELFFGPLREEIAAIVFKPFAHCYDIVPAKLEEAVVVHGAIALACGS